MINEYFLTYFLVKIPDCSVVVVHRLWSREEKAVNLVFYVLQYHNLHGSTWKKKYLHIHWCWFLVITSLIFLLKVQLRWQMMQTNCNFFPTIAHHRNFANAYNHLTKRNLYACARQTNNRACLCYPKHK